MNKPTATPAALRRLLLQELLLGKRLLTLCEEESETIVTGDVLRLIAIQERQQQTLEQQRVLEVSRANTARDLSWTLGLEKVTTLVQILPALNVRDREELNALRLQIIAVQTDLDRVNDRNRLLLENALAYVRFSLETLTSVALQPARYGTNLATLATPSFYVDSKA